jgi:hypothetical protein
LLLWPTIQSHLIICPSICFSASGHYLAEDLTNKLFCKHAGKSDCIDKLRQQVSHWLSDADLYIDLVNLRGRASVPIRTIDPIRADLRFADIVITRLGSSRDAGDQHPSYSQDPEPDTTGRVARLSGADASFSIPVCLLLSHGYLAPLPLESSESGDTVPVEFSTRASLPAHFSETFLNFVATFSKTFQLLDIKEDEQEEDEEVVGDEAKAEVEVKDSEKEDAPTPASPNPSFSASVTNSPTKLHHHGFHHYRAKLSQSSPKLTSALHLDGRDHHSYLAPQNQKTFLQQHPLIRHPKQILQQSMKKNVVETINSAWCAKWSNKVLRKLEDAEGDLGYSGKMEVGVMRGDVETVEAVM